MCHSWYSLEFEFPVHDSVGFIFLSRKSKMASSSLGAVIQMRNEERERKITEAESQKSRGMSPVPEPFG